MIADGVMWEMGGIFLVHGDAALLQLTAVVGDEAQSHVYFHPQIKDSRSSKTALLQSKRWHDPSRLQNQYSAVDFLLA
jgi:hypothetical protein